MANLSCGNCKTIRPFSGTPLACEVCGWVCPPTTEIATAPGLYEFEQNVEEIEPRLEGIELRLDEIEERLDGIDQRLDKIETRLDKVKPGSDWGWVLLFIVGFWLWCKLTLKIEHGVDVPGIFIPGVGTLVFNTPYAYFTLAGAAVLIIWIEILNRRISKKSKNHTH